MECRGFGRTAVHPFFQKSLILTVEKEFHLGVCGVVEADFKLFRNSCREGILGERLYIGHCLAPNPADGLRRGCWASTPSTRTYQCSRGYRAHVTKGAPPVHFRSLPHLLSSQPHVCTSHCLSRAAVSAPGVALCTPLAVRAAVARRDGCPATVQRYARLAPTGRVQRHMIPSAPARRLSMKSFYCHADANTDAYTARHRRRTP